MSRSLIALASLLIVWEGAGYSTSESQGYSEYSKLDFVVPYVM